MLKGRLGLESARLPHSDRKGLISLSRGTLTAQDGTLCFGRSAEPDPSSPLEKGDYLIPIQPVSVILLGPGSTVSHDALRLLGRAGVALAAVGEDGVRCYTAPPLTHNDSGLARRQARVWADEDARLSIARRLYAWRLGEILPHRDIAVLRGIEGARMKETYRLTAQRIGVPWEGRRYDRADPLSADAPNQALNHAATALEAAAAIAVTATATIPQLGFIHEDPSQSFVLDISDLFRDAVAVPAAFRAAKAWLKDPSQNLERLARRETGSALARQNVIDGMIEKIKELFGDP